MKNIHVLPTDKPSKLSINCQTGLLQLGLNNRMFHDDINIYITSDEEIKEGEYGLSKLGEIIKFNSGYDYRYYYEIILTTDQDLIKDGVQAIPDDFLEWFVKNPTCERVEVEKWNNIEPNGKLSYEIPLKNLTIPKEESYSEIQQNSLKLNKIFVNSIDAKSLDDIMSEFDEPKQETFEEAAETYSENWEEITGLDYENSVPSEVNKLDFINGAKWQSERMYSEDEVWNIIRMVSGMKESGKSDIEISEYFENNKKK